MHGAVVAVAQGESVGERELKREFGFLVIGHRGVGLDAGQ